MNSNWNRTTRWLLLAASGAVLLQTSGCDLFLQTLQTGLLAALTGITFYLAQNV